MTSGETVSLPSAIRFAEDYATLCRRAASSTDQLVANLRQSKVTDASVRALVAAMNTMSAAANNCDATHDALKGQLPVMESYQAAPGAGEKRFLQSE